jgi:hypothetical protein
VDGVTGLDGTDGALGATGLSGANGKRGVAIYNEGVVKTGQGKDTIDAWQGGFDGGGDFYLGLGGDTVKGFGNGTFYGGLGQDTFILPGQQSDYTIANLPGFNSNAFTKDGMTLNAFSFENIQYIA